VRKKVLRVCKKCRTPTVIENGECFNCGEKVAAKLERSSE
jgi:rRNA maturation protein Nop10